MSLLTELKRRKVFRVAAVYAATAFVVLQAADLLAAGLSLPGWVFPAITVLVVVGFPIALVLAWAFELTREGVKRTGESTPAASIAAPPAQALRVRASFRSAAIAGGILVLLTAGWLLWRTLQPEAVLAAGNTIAVLPFDVRGSEGVAYLDEGIVDLLSVKLSGADDLQAVDTRALLGFLARHANQDEEHAGRRVAERFGARFFVLGSVVEFGGEMQLRASLYEMGTEPRRIAQADAAGSGEDLFRLIDELAAQLLAGRAVGAPGRLTRLAAVTTDSIDALRAYLSGERAYRGTDFTRAVEHFQAALRIDSTFALAGYRLAASAVWAARRDLVRDGLEIALRHATRLGDRDRLLLAAHAADELDHDFARADSLYRQILLTYRDEADAWYRLGEIVLHQAPWLGYRRSDAREPFERALSIDPGMGPALYHAVSLAAERKDTVALDTLVRRFERVSNDPNDSLFTTVDRIFFRGDTARYGWAERQIAMTVEPVNGYYAHQAAALSIERDPAAARRLWAVIAERSPSAPMRAWGYAGLADIEATRGRLAAAEAELDRIGDLDRALALQQRVQLALHPLRDPTPEALRRARDDVMRWAPGTVAAERGGPLERVQFGREGPAIRLFLLGLLDTHLGDLSAARQRILEIRASAATDSVTKRSFAAILESEITRQQGDAREALRLLEAAPFWRGRSVQMQTGTLAFAREVFERAELLREAGRAEDAVRAYDVVVDNIPLFYRGPALLRLCEMHAAAGRRDDARDACGRFVALWRDADPPLRRWLEVARRF